MKHAIVTTSWDDGHKLDLKLSDILKHYDIKGTFYISPETREFPAAERLTAKEIRHLAQNFEIGAHTMTHPRLNLLDEISARREIVDSKTALERIIDNPVSSFCYPYGSYNQEIQRFVREAGFERARTVKRFATHIVDQLALGTSVDTYDHYRDGMLPVLRLCGRRPWQVFNMRRWDELAKAMFLQAQERGEIFHLWGHSHDIAAHNDWGRLESFLIWLRAQKNVGFVSNADLPIQA